MTARTGTTIWDEATRARIKASIRDQRHKSTKFFAQIAAVVVGILVALISAHQRVPDQLKEFSVGVVRHTGAIVLAAGDVMQHLGIVL